MRKKALFAVSSLGLGHATRTSVIIRLFLEKGFEIDIISFGNALNFLKNEFQNTHVSFIELEDYPPIERGNGWNVYYYLIHDLIKTNFLIFKEHLYIKSISTKYDFIFSDGRYGIYSKKIPSFLLSHQLSFIMPKGLNHFSKIMDFFNYLSFKKFHFIFIPDFEEKANSLAGNMSHPKRIHKLNHAYIGILSSFYKYEKKEDKKIDYLFTISGYLLDNKENFIQYLLQQAKKLPGKKVFVLGDTKNDYKIEKENDITIYSFVGGEERKELFSQAEVIISRAGYTTIMDLVELKKTSLLFPTPNQTEQEYLAEFLQESNHFTFGDEKSDLLQFFSIMRKNNIIFSGDTTKNALIKIENIISNSL